MHIYRSDDERPDGASWYGLCSFSYYKAVVSSEAGAVENDDENHKKLKYCHFDFTHAFVLMAVETFGVLDREAQSILREVPCCIVSFSGDPQSRQFPLQQVAAAVQWENSLYCTLCIYYGSVLFCYGVLIV